MSKNRFLSLILIFLASAVISGDTYFVIDNNTNTVLNRYFAAIYKNPAAHFNHPHVTYSLTFKDALELDNIGFIIPLGNLYIGLGSFNKTPYYENAVNLKYGFGDYLNIGMTYFGVIDTSTSSPPIESMVNIGVTIYPFTREFKKGGQLTNFCLSFYYDGLVRSEDLKSLFPRVLGIGAGFFYKESLKIFFNSEKTEGDDPELGIGFAAKLREGFNLYFGGKLNGVSVGCEYIYGDVSLMAGFNRTDGRNTARVNINFIPGNTHNLLARELLRSGIEAYKNMDYERAIEIFNQVLGINPGNDEAKQFINLSKERIQREADLIVNKKMLNIVQLIRDKKVEEAKQEFDELKKYHPGYESKWSQLLEKFPKEAKHIREKLDEAPKENGAAFTRKLAEVNKLIAEKDLPEAKRSFSILKDIPKSAEREYQKTKDDLEKAIAERVSILVNGVQKGINDDNLTFFEEILALDRENVFAKNSIISYYLNKGEVFYRNQDFENALRMWQKVLEYETSNSKALQYIETTKKKMEQRK